MFSVGDVISVPPSVFGAEHTSCTVEEVLKNHVVLYFKSDNSTVKVDVKQANGWRDGGGGGGSGGNTEKPKPKSRGAAKQGAAAADAPTLASGALDAEPVESEGGRRPKRAAAARSASGLRATLDELELDSDEGMDSDDDDARPKPKRSRSEPKVIASRKKRAKAQSSDDEAYGEESDYEDEPKPAKGKAKPVRGGAAARKKSAPARSSSGARKRAPARKAPAPKEAPQPFVDPAGLDIEDRGVEWIIEQQCAKLAPLLADAISRGELAPKIATACSGTDAPVVAMTCAREALERTHGVEFKFDHVMSCELEPYKQSFIARNYPDVLLFPDIVSLGATARGGTTKTVYGGMASVPAADMIVAGTSCKDFSNLKGRDRKSIEAMGTSGQTFFGFV